MLIRTYYLLKPYIPRSARMGVRQWVAARTRKKRRDVWPILPGSERLPAGWQGWPNGKKFAVVLTHDVEGQNGLDKCRDLMKLEIKAGFRSSYNFIPEGEYRVSPELRTELEQNGFEVAVHDLHHDGHLFSSRPAFSEKASRINRYLREWNSVGFRSGFMLNRRGWMHELDVEWEGTSFDTDPFEPQPKGARTIFPSWTLRPSASQKGNAGGYVELPYTMAQDSTLFLILKESSPEIWMRKLDWIAERGGMVLMNTHPDYMDLKGDGSRGTYPVQWYLDVLNHIQQKHAGAFWHALPKEMAAFVRQQREVMTLNTSAPENPRATHRRSSPVRGKIWIDLDNTPHIPFFRPILRELEARGHEVMLTARDAYQVCEMAKKFGLEPTVIGRHYGKNRLRKFLGFLYRTLQLLPKVRAEKPTLALNHGSRSQVLLSNMLRIPSVTIMDYEHSKSVPLARPTWMIVPQHFPAQIPGLKPERVRRYSGIKEDVYAPEFVPNPSILQELGLEGTGIIVTVRPPASEAHYHNEEGERLFETFIDRICATDNVKAVILPRNKRQEEQIRKDYPQWFQHSKAIIPTGVVDGLNLLWHSDLVVSGGGTMNREAAALGVPVYSIFRGKTAAIDKRLQDEGRMFLIGSTQEVREKIPLVARDKSNAGRSAERPALSEIIGHIEEILQHHAIR